MSADEGAGGSGLEHRSVSVRERRGCGARPARQASHRTVPRGGARCTIEPPANRLVEEARDAPNDPCRARPGQLDRRQGIDDPEARGAGPRGGQAGRPDHPVPGALLRALLLPGPGRPVLQLHRAHPRRPDDEADAGPREADRAWSSSCRCTRRTARPSGIYYNTAAVIDADGTYLGKYRKTHIPHVKGFWEKFYFRPGQPRLPGVRDRGRQGRRVHLLRPALPRGRPRARAQRRRDRAHPERHVARPVASTCGGSSSPATRSPTATTSARSTASASRPTSATTTSTARATSCDPRGQFVGDVGIAHDEELIVRDLDLDLIMEVRNTWQFYRDRRPDAYERPRPAP